MASAAAPSSSAVLSVPLASASAPASGGPSACPTPKHSTSSPAPGIEGLWILTGGGRRGILMSAAMGKIGADLLTTGRTELDLAPFSLERFGVTTG